MVWRVEFTTQAQKALEWIQKREPILFPRIIDVLESLRKNPFQGKVLKGELIARYSYRVGSYRIVYRLHKGELAVIVIKIGHRRDVYR